MADTFDVREFDLSGLDTSRIEAWTNLSRKPAYGEWFASPHWILPLCKTYFADSSLALQFVYSGSSLVGVIPMVSQSTGHRTGLGFPVNSHVRRIGAVGDRPLDVLFDVVVADLKRRGGAHEIAFRQIPREGELHSAIVSSCRRNGLGYFRREESRSAIADLSLGWEQYVGALEGRHLHNLRKQRKMEKSGVWATHAFHTPALFDTGWTALLDIERQSWKHSSGTSIANEPGAAEFYSAVCSSCATDGMLRLHISYHEQSPAAHTLGVVHNGIYYLLKHSYAEPFKQWSPGLLLVWQVMKECADEGITQFDFLGDAMSWKLDFATKSPAYESITAFSPLNVRGQWNRLAESFLKPIARRLRVKEAFNRLSRRPS
jgi:CelD/BcsL family acetyltransferase involved in cellulose biosynthesis